MQQSPEVIQRINYLRTQSRMRELSQEELREAIALMRQGRVGAAATSEKSRAKKAPINSDDLLNQLEGL